MVNIEENLIQTNALIEQHIHGGFGIDFLKDNCDKIVEFAQKITRYGVAAFYPTLATADIETLKKQITQIKLAKSKLPDDAADILGIHLEACFLNPEKKGIHDETQLMLPTIENYKKLEDEFISIVTLAPELDEQYELCNYLKSKGVKVSAGHCLATDLSAVNQVTHLFNAMGDCNHKTLTTSIAAMADENLDVEVIADLKHVLPEVLKVLFKTKPHNKIILISDALPIANSEIESMEFCNKKIYLKDGRAVDDNETMAGSVMFVKDIIKQLVETRMLGFMTAVTMASLNINPNKLGTIYWDEDFNIKHMILKEKQIF